MRRCAVLTQIKARRLARGQGERMTETVPAPPQVRAIRSADLRDCLRRGWADFRATPLLGMFFANAFVVSGLVMSVITLATGTTFWLVLAVLGFPLVGSLAALGFYEISRSRAAGERQRLGAILAHVWAQRGGQLPWLAATIVVIFLFWFFLGHMIFALFLGLAPMTNISSSLAVFGTTEGLSMLLFGSAVGAVFAVVVFAISVIGMPLLVDRDIDFVTAMITSVKAVRAQPALYLGWGALIAVVTLLAMVPLFLGLFVAMPVLGHATWHLYGKAIAPAQSHQPTN